LKAGDEEKQFKGLHKKKMMILIHGC
jgi:hypothetical protein